MTMKLNANPVETWRSLTSAAVLGLDRAGLTEEGPAFLRRAGVLSVYLQAGQTGVKGDGNPGEPFDGREKTCSARAAGHLREILFGEYRLLLGEWCQAARQGGWHAPPECLPDLLDGAAQMAPAERRTLREVVGPRGLWLAAQNPAWKDIFALRELDEQDWHNGTTLERRDFLLRLRGQDPSRARELLMETWEQESPEDRAGFLETLVVGLSLEDEPFLEQGLDDRRKPVRQQAADLLARLPASGLCRRMQERVFRLVTWRPGGKGLLKLKKPALEVELPDITDKSLLRDGADPRKAGKMGEKASALANMVAAVPLGAWEKLEANREALLDAALASEFAVSFALGFATAAIRRQNAAWATALLERAALIQDKLGAAGQNTFDATVLLQCLEPEARERFIERFAAQSWGGKHKDSVYDFLLACDHTWSEAFSRFAFKVIQQHFISHPGNYMLRRPITEVFARRLSPAMAERAGEGWPEKSNRFTAGDEEMVCQLTAILQFRNQMHKELSRET